MASRINRRSANSAAAAAAPKLSPEQLARIESATRAHLEKQFGAAPAPADLWSKLAACSAIPNPPAAQSKPAPEPEQASFMIQLAAWQAENAGKKAIRARMDLEQSIRDLISGDYLFRRAADLAYLEQEALAWNDALSILAAAGSADAFMEALDAIRRRAYDALERAAMDLKNSRSGISGDSDGIRSAARADALREIGKECARFHRGASRRGLDFDFDPAAADDASKAADLNRLISYALAISSCLAWPIKKIER